MRVSIALACFVTTLSFLAPTLPIYAQTTSTQATVTYPRKAKEFSSAVVIDVKTGKVIYEYQAQTVWPAASLTKLMGALVFMDHHPAWNKVVALSSKDEVGGGRLRVANGAKLLTQDLLYSSITASANNAAMAMARLSGLGYSGFIRAMNTKARQLNLKHTSFVDASGMNPKNVTTAMELAKIAMIAFDIDRIRLAATTQKYRFIIRNTGAVKEIKNTNDLLVGKEYERLFVTGGKTGFLNESGYNLAVRLKSADVKSTDPALMVVVFGAPTRASSFKTAAALADWVWQKK